MTSSLSAVCDRYCISIPTSLCPIHIYAGGFSAHHDTLGSIFQNECHAAHGRSLGVACDCWYFRDKLREAYCAKCVMWHKTGQGYIEYIISGCGAAEFISSQSNDLCPSPLRAMHIAYHCNERWGYQYTNQMSLTRHSFVGGPELGCHFLAKIEF